MLRGWTHVRAQEILNGGGILHELQEALSCRGARFSRTIGEEAYGHDIRLFGVFVTGLRNTLRGRDCIVLTASCIVVALLRK